MIMITRKIGREFELKEPATVMVLAVKGDAVRLAIDSPCAVLKERENRQEPPPVRPD